jgi:hypothetical protein
MLVIVKPLLVLSICARCFHGAEACEGHPFALPIKPSLYTHLDKYFISIIIFIMDLLVIKQKQGLLAYFRHIEINVSLSILSIFTLYYC